MASDRSCVRRRALVVGLVLLMAFGAGCDALIPLVAGGTVGVTAVGAHAPAQEIQQVYYLGVFDPQEQVDPTVYRVTVHGQASVISRMKFGSGWVPANVVDALNTSIGFDKKSDRPVIRTAEGKDPEGIQTGRRLVLFGPEGFREAPADHRLVIVMGSDPEAYFRAVDEVLGVVAGAQQEQRNSTLRTALFEALLQIEGQRERLDDLGEDAERDLPEGKEVQP